MAIQMEETWAQKKLTPHESNPQQIIPGIDLSNKLQAVTKKPWQHSISAHSSHIDESTIIHLASRLPFHTI